MLRQSAADDHRALLPTRRALHGVAELVIAGPQYRDHGTIRMRIVPGGFAGIVSGVRVEGTDLVAGAHAAPIAGTARQLADALGIEAGAPADLYDDSSGVDVDEPLAVDAGAAAEIAAWFATGDAALRATFPDVEPVLWPEHFDLAVSVDEVNYGVSPGDAEHPAAVRLRRAVERALGFVLERPLRCTSAGHRPRRRRRRRCLLRGRPRRPRLSAVPGEVRCARVRPRGASAEGSRCVLRCRPVYAGSAISVAVVGQRRGRRRGDGARGGQFADRRHRIGVGEEPRRRRSRHRDRWRR